MLKVGLMIEGQNGLNWERWQKIVTAAEELGFWGVFRSDHFTNARPPEKNSLELWVSLTWMAGNTKRLHFGPLVTPMSFRHPAFTARMAAAVDDLSGGRLILGLGAGWQEREHEMFGFDLLDLDSRFSRFEEGIEVIRLLLQSDVPVDFEGKFFTLKQAIMLPRPQRPGGPALLVGGNGRRRTLPLVAKYASEWNALFLPPNEFKRLNGYLDQLLEAEGRESDSVRRSLMTGCVFGRDSSEIEVKVQQRTNGKGDSESLRQRGLLVGTAPEIRRQLNAYEQAGAAMVFIQWLDLDDLDGLEMLARGIIST